MRFGGDTELHAPMSEVTFQKRLHCTDFGALVSLLGTQGERTCGTGVGVQAEQPASA